MNFLKNIWQKRIGRNGKNGCFKTEERPILTIEKILNGERDLELKDITNLLIKKYNKVLTNFNNFTDRIESYFGAYNKEKNYFKGLKSVLLEDDLNIAIDLDKAIKELYSQKRKLEKLDIKKLDADLPLEFLEGNIQDFLIKIKDSYKASRKFLNAIEAFINKKIESVNDNLDNKKLANFQEAKNIDNNNYQAFKTFLEIYENYRISNNLSNRLEQWFFGFWVKRFRVSIIILVLIVLYWGFSLYVLPKETNPEIDFGIITIGTLYTGVNPEDIDSLITEKIEDEIKDIEDIKKISSTSRLGFSSIVLELEDDANVQEVLVDVKDKVDSVTLPSEAEDPVVNSIDSDSKGSNIVFDVMLYGDEKQWSLEQIREKARRLKSLIEGKKGISKIDYSFDNDYEILVLLNKSKVETLGLTPSKVASIIRDNNKNQPIGNYTIGEKKYDFRFDGELNSIAEFGEIPIKYADNSVIKLKDIAQIKKEYKTDSITRVGFYNDIGYNMVSMVFKKAAGTSVMAVADDVKVLLDDLLKQEEFKGLQVTYGIDLSKLVRQNYANVATSGLQTLVLVFVALLFFIGIKEALIGSCAVPLAFLVTFGVLNIMGLTMNTVVNFSLIISFGIAIDTTIVIIEGASELLKQGYNPKSAILLAVKSYASSLISGTMTTLAAFLPMLWLPGVMGKFLSYIPLTISITLLAALLISLTLMSMLFFKLNSPLKIYIADDEDEKKLRREERELLKYERRGKEKLASNKKTIRDKIFDKIKVYYKSFLHFNLDTRLRRWITILVPVVAVVLTFIFISPSLGFTIFPSEDSGTIWVKLGGPVGVTEDYMRQYYDDLEQVFVEIPEEEMDNFDIRINDNLITANIELVDQKIRKQQKLRKAEEIETWLEEKLWYLRSEGLKFQIELEAGGPPSDKPVGIKLIADSNQKFKELIVVAKDFETFLRSVNGTKNIGNSGDETPWQFVFRLDKEKLMQLGLTPSQVLNEIYFATFGADAGSFKGDVDDFDIKVKYEEFEKRLSPSELAALYINTSIGKIKVENILEKTVGDDFVSFDNAVKSIKREDTKVMIKVSSDLKADFTQDQVMPKLTEFAENYDFPDGVSFETAGEAEENQDLIIATVQSFVIALFLIFLILVLQFGSYAQPLIILYSVVLALLGVNLGLWITDNPYSVSFGIGLIALTGIVVNDAIVLIDRYNKNLQKGGSQFEAISEAGCARLNPIILTTLTTLLGMLPVALQDKFWAGLAYTVIFGLFAGSLMTLNVIPALILELDFLEKVLATPFRIIGFIKNQIWKSFKWAWNKF